MIAIGAKRIETRSWPTRHRGPLAIHAAKRWDAELRSVCSAAPFHDALTAGGYPPPYDLPRGCVVATCELIACVRTEELTTPGVAPRPQLPHERDFGNYEPGRWAWILADVRPLRAMMVCQGGRGLFELPAEFARGGET